MKHLSGVTILVVDDHEILREILKDLFETEGAHVIEAEGVEQAWDILVKGNISIVVSDVRLSGSNGFVLAKKVQEELSYRVGFFLCTGYNDKSSAELARLGIDGLFDKPLNEAAIIKAISEKLSKLNNAA